MDAITQGVASLSATMLTGQLEKWEIMVVDKNLVRPALTGALLFAYAKFITQQDTKGAVMSALISAGSEGIAGFVVDGAFGAIGNAVSGTSGSTPQLPNVARKQSRPVVHAMGPRA